MGQTYSTTNVQNFIEKTIDIEDSGNKYINVNFEQMALDLTNYLIENYNNDPYVEKAVIRKWFYDNWDKEFNMDESLVYEVRKAYAKDRDLDQEMMTAWFDNIN